MKYILIITFLSLFVIGCDSNNKKDKFYSVDTTTDLLISPSVSSKKLIDNKASSITNKEEYCTLDNSNKVIVLETKGRFCKVKVVEPEWQTDTYIGWIPVANLVEFGSVGSKASKLMKVNIQYEIIKEEKYEDNYKAQLKEYAFYKDSIYTKEALKNVLMEIYNLNRDKYVFQNHSAPTVIGAYLFTSKEATKNTSDWIAMLVKAPNDTEPIVSFNDFKITALTNIKNNIKGEDEIEVDKLKIYLKKRGLDLCTLSDMLTKIELDNIHKADAKYPDYGNKHMAMIDELDALSYKQLEKKYKLNKKMLGKVSTFAMAYCK